MKEASPTKGAGSDESHRDNGSVAGFARRDSCGKGIVRTGSSRADPIQLSATTTGGAFSQRSRGLDSEERSPSGDPDDRGSGKSDGTRSDRRETSGGSCSGLSAGWREVAEELHAEEGLSHE